MAGPTAKCAAENCRKGALKHFAYQLEEIPLKFEIPLCGIHIGIVAADPATVIRAMDEETKALREKLALEAENAQEIGAGKKLTVIGNPAAATIVGIDGKELASGTGQPDGEGSGTRKRAEPEQDAGD